MEYSIQLNKHQEDLLSISGMTVQSIIEDKLQHYEIALRDNGEKELLAKAKRAYEKDPVSFEELAKEVVEEPIKEKDYELL